MEGTYSSWTNRLLSIVCNIKTTHFSDTRLLGADGLETLDKATRGIAEAPIYLEAKKINHVDRLCEVARLAKKELGIHIIFIDYVQLLNSRDGFSDNRYLDLNYITRRLNELAKELDIPVVILSQLSRHKNDDEGLEARRPRLTDLRDSGTIEEDSDMVILLHRPEFFHIYQDEKGNDLHNMIEISVEKNRFGTTGRCLAQIDKETGTITDVSESHDAHEYLNHGNNNEESAGNLHPKTPGSDFPLPF